MKIIVENINDAWELVDFTKERGISRKWRTMTDSECKALAEFIGDVGHKGDLYEFSDNYLINADKIEEPTEEQKQDALFVYDEDGVTIAVMSF